MYGSIVLTDYTFQKTGLLGIYKGEPKKNVSWESYLVCSFCGTRVVELLHLTGVTRPKMR